LEGRYQKHTKGLINDKYFNSMEINQIHELASSIDSKFKNSDVNRHLIAEIGSEFYEIILPELYQLTAINQRGMPRGIQKLLISIIAILIFGVVIPLYFSLFPIGSMAVRSLILSGSGSMVIWLFINFIFDFSNLLNTELKLKD
jgi:hypothetical protein